MKKKQNNNIKSKYQQKEKDIEFQNKTDDENYEYSDYEIIDDGE